MFCLQNLGLPRRQWGQAQGLRSLSEATWSSHISAPSASHPASERGSATSPSFQMGNLRLGEVESLPNSGRAWAQTQF